LSVELRRPLEVGLFGFLFSVVADELRKIEFEKGRAALA
jgi:hypothetical protein